MLPPVFVGALCEGLVLGLFYASIALGFSLVWAAMRIINVSHAAFVLIVSYVVVSGARIFSADSSMLIMLMIMTPVMFGVGVIYYRYVISQLYRSPNYEGLSLVACFGVAIVIQNVLLLAFGTAYQGIVPSFASINVGPVSFSKVSAAIVSIIVTVLAYFLLRRTYIGKAVRAAWQDPMAASLHGINVVRVRSIMFGVSLAMAVPCGIYLPIIQVIYPHVHWSYIIYVFIIVIVGGVGSIPGTITAAIIVGLIESLSNALLPSAYVPLILYVFLIALLLGKPSGLFKA
jgi:branched-chain amino acid transport system permease protein